MKTMFRRGGFTLPEVLVTVTVVAVLAAVVVPAVTQFSSKGDGAATVQDFGAIRSGVSAYLADKRATPKYLYDVAGYSSLILGPSATTATTYKAAGYGFTVGNAFDTTSVVEGGITYITLSLTSPTSTKSCDDIDKELDGVTTADSAKGNFRYSVIGTTSPCTPALYILTSK